MKSIEARFNRFEHESIGSYVAFARAVNGQQFSRDTISRNFLKFVDKSDYDKKDKNQIIDYLTTLSYSLRDTK